jgi:hypothetical protein
MKRLIKGRLFIFAWLALVLALALGTDLWRRMPLPWVWLGELRDECFSNFDFPGLQWAWGLCFGVYLACFALVRWQSRGQRKTQLPTTPGGSSSVRETSSLLLTGLAIWAAAAYAFHHFEESATTDFAVFMGGITIAQAVSIFKGWSWSKEDACLLLADILGTLVLVLTMAVLLLSGARWHDSYRGAGRWSGPWTDPNRCGLMMGTGVVISLGLAAWYVGRRRWIPAILPLISAILLAGGLTRTYSRGSWLGTLLALAYLAFVWRNTGATRPRWLRWVGRNLSGLMVIGISVGVLAFWNFRESEQTLVRRTFSPANKNDFASQNRLAAYEGGLQIMADNPLLGLGWDTPKGIYNGFYESSRLVEGKAIELNDYFTLGMTLGIPALACFVWGIYRCFRIGEAPRNRENGPSAARQSSDKTRPTTRETDGPTRSIQWLEATCRAGVIVLLVGFWFERALCFISTGATFWMLLELGSVTGAKRENLAAHIHNPPHKLAGPQC